MDTVEHIKQWLDTGSINIFGIQFSGKDTVGHELTKLLGAQFISSGDVMRDIFTRKEQVQDQQLWEASRVGSLSGSLMPTNEFQQMIVHRLSQPDLAGKPLVLSTVGRWIGEEQPVLHTLQHFGHPTKVVLLLNISESEVWKRWDTARHTRNGGRHDDISEDKVATRLKEYYEKTTPVIEVYRKMNILLEINGEQPPQQVMSDVIEQLYKFSLASTSL